MQLNTSMAQRMEQRMSLAPRMIQSMEILQMPVMDLQEKIEQELQENPVLELREGTPEEGAEEAESVVEPQSEWDDVTNPEKELVIDEKGDNELDFDRLEAMARDYEDMFDEEHRPSRNGLDEAGDRKHDAMQNMPSRPQSLQDYLNDQLSFLDCTPAEAKLMRFTISHIDDSGYLKLSLEDIARGYDEPVPIEQVQAALTKIQHMDPPGVGARNPQECLLLQLTPEMPCHDVLKVLISNHLDDIQHNRLPMIQRRTGYSIELIKEAIEALKHFNLRPGSQFIAEEIPYVVPDIVVERAQDGEYTVRLLDDWVPNIYIPKRHLDAYRNQTTSAKDKEWLKRKIQSAQWLLESIEQRRSTLEKVTKAIIRHQRNFFDQGPEYIEPLKMQQIADQVGVHVTTVSRAVDDKWVQTPRGLFPLKRFFGGGTHTASGEEVAWEKIKQKLLEVIGAEDKNNPLSDEDLVEKLNASDCPVARRTVTKYRKMLKIPSSRQRKEWSSGAT